MTAPALPATPALERRLSGSPLVVFLDVDGTLSQIAPRPTDAVVSAETRRVLCDLVSLPAVHVVALSGRSADDTRRLVNVGKVWIIGNHGIEVAPPDGPPTVRHDVARYEPIVAAAAKRAEDAARSRAGVLVEDKRWTLSVHYRLADAAIAASLHAAIAAIAAELGLRISQGKKVLELRPPVAIDKGIAAVDLARKLGALRSGTSMVCAGDDRTDEDAFRALRAAEADAVTIRVGFHPEDTPDETAAEFSVRDTDTMREFLEWLARFRRLPASPAS